MENSTTPWWVLPGLAMMILGIFGGVVCASFFTNNNDLRTTMATAAVNLAFGIGGYYFGSSAGSQKKDDVIARKTEVAGKVGIPELKENEL